MTAPRCLFPPLPVHNFARGVHLIDLQINRLDTVKTVLLQLSRARRRNGNVSKAEHFGDLVTRIAVPRLQLAVYQSVYCKSQAWTSLFKAAHDLEDIENTLNTTDTSICAADAVWIIRDVRHTIRHHLKAVHKIFTPPGRYVPFAGAGRPPPTEFEKYMMAMKDEITKSAARLSEMMTTNGHRTSSAASWLSLSRCDVEDLTNEWYCGNYIQAYNVKCQMSGKLLKALVEGGMEKDKIMDDEDAVRYESVVKDIVCTLFMKLVCVENHLEAEKRKVCK